MGSASDSSARSPVAQAVIQSPISPNSSIRGGTGGSALLVAPRSSTSLGLGCMTPGERATSMYIATDLHGHTHFSDGRATPEGYVDFRRQLGMRVVAISDHDVLAAVERGASAAVQARL